MDAGIFVFEIFLHNNRKVFCSFPIVKENQSASNERIAGTKWVFLCFKRRGLYRSFFHILYQDLETALQTLKIPGKVLEFYPNQKGRTLVVLFLSI